MTRVTAKSGNIPQTGDPKSIGTGFTEGLKVKPRLCKRFDCNVRLAEHVHGSILAVRSTITACSRYCQKFGQTGGSSYLAEPLRSANSVIDTDDLESKHKRKQAS